MTLSLDANTVFELARKYGTRPDLATEVDWQRNALLEEFSEQDLLRETAWVILCSGFRERVVRSKFNYISLCYFDWESAELIASKSSICVSSAVSSFGNRRKLEAIAECASVIVKNGFCKFKKRILREPISELQALPFIGPITAWHLAKNLGLDVAKPDRHLVRLATASGYSTANELCTSLAERYHEQVNVVDLLLWRYLADHPRVVPMTP